MTSTIAAVITLPEPRAGNPEYFCPVCQTWHADTCSAVWSVLEEIAKEIQREEDAAGPDPEPTALAAAPLPVLTGNGGWQCDRCGGRFGAAPAPAGATAWTCPACENLGY
ncbi:hypothetical protein ABT112_33650 [Streptomyces sp. NPDC002055]|uniref:hypothetical protein n=1 Tax=Streptomyces sp. NPDC002055 TaxID=3154534 RepID=UPI003325A783